MTKFLFIALGLEFLGIAAGTFFLKRIKKRFLFLYLFLLVAFTTEILKPILYYGYNVRHNIELSHYYFPLEFLFLALLYLKELDGFVNRKWLKALIGVFMLYCLINPIFLQDYHQYSQVRSFSSIILVFFSILYYYRVLTETKIGKLANEPMIWINTAVLLYFAGSLFYNVLFTIILEFSREFLKLGASYFLILNLIFYTLITIGIIKAGRQYKTKLT